MINTLLTATAEHILNTILSLEPSVQASLSKVQHQVLAVEVRDWQQTIAVTFTGHSFMVFNNYQEHIDCHISASIDTLSQLKDPSQLTRLIRQGELDLEGNLHLAQAYSQIFSELDIDWAEHLSKYVGDGPAQLLVQQLRQAKQRTKQLDGVLKTTTAGLFQDELKVAIHPLEMAQFKAHTRELKQHAAVLEQRINQLLAR
ncbi:MULTISPECIES: ubiquinone biosynthesis accessory factor UbiJ [Pseudoalteromonas]|uniref:Ubiquinone biosynthesis accessory factor UbiJ n=1 Tax=Pseudoalteromonas amylolytica TaxID=1859457 RepID=A0A1S1N104_9GAMM|nr:MULTISPECIES: SCP2 sterol-binding domain-containing protein [Pseudoalteromonas]MCF6436437.1 SCP2 sterol-binding domain-containing protein [Pseudoalteromonas sp. MMG022]OHU91803.1 ubiquinone carrier protein [Pseudoalteromonas sp. JW3]OHU93129.1 ubiquinone carrier protein [Pseudoalteromonas amylolytica]